MKNRNILKKVLKIGGIIVAIVVVLLIALMISVGWIAKSTINSVGAQMLGVSECSVGNVIFNPFGGKFGISKLKIGFPQANPDDKIYSQNVFEVEKISVNLNLQSLFSDTILIEDLTVKGLVLSYEKPLTAGTNIDAIVAHLSGGNAENADGNAEKSENSENSEISKNSDVPASEIYIAADKIDIDGAQVWVHVGPIPTPLPPLTINLKDVGKERKLTPAMFGVRVLMNFLNVLNRVDLGVVSDVAGTASDAAMDAAGTAVDVVGNAAGTATDAAKNAAGTLINVFTGTPKFDENSEEK